jgi:hypothetical protein
MGPGSSLKTHAELAPNRFSDCIYESRFMQTTLSIDKILSTIDSIDVIRHGKSTIKDLELRRNFVWTVFIALF